MENHHGDLSSRSEGMDSSHERSYDCFFCKRGFSTAQALGGHMNIHRKDRAKQKQQLATNHGSSTALYFNLPNISFSPSGSLKIKGRQYSTSVSGSGGESETSSIMRWPRSYYRGDDAHLEEIDGLKRPLWQQLPFLVERPSADVDHGGECPLRSITSELLISAEEELDLELRLGPSTPCGGATGEKRKMEVKEVRRP